MSTTLFQRGLAATCLACLLTLYAPSVAWAQDEASDAVEETTEAEASTSAVDPSLDNAYTVNSLIMFLCAVLVIFMQAGFAMVEVGLNASKNTVNILFKNLMDFAIGVLLFIFIGYAIMYPGSDYAGKWFGYSGSPGINGMGFYAAQAEKSVDVNSATPWSPNSDFLFQVAFAATAATIVSGAVAGRMKFNAYLIYSAVISGFVYPVSGMWKWGGGWLHAAGFQDFAGSILVHSVGGFAGLAGAILLGPRLGRFVSGKSIPIPGHNLTFATLGVFILWVGWYGFNPGSQLTYAGSANANATAYIAVTTTLAAAAGCLAAKLFGWMIFGKPDLTMALNGALAGLVGITANCNNVSLSSSIIIGAIAGVLVVLGIVFLDKLKIDDPVGAFPVHGVCGIWGGLATGVFGEVLPSTSEGVALTRAEFIKIQAIGTVTVVVWAFVTMFVLFGIIKAMGFLRVSPEEEQTGLDISEHGMKAYIH